MGINARPPVKAWFPRMPSPRAGTGLFGQPSVSNCWGCSDLCDGIEDWNLESDGGCNRQVAHH